MAEIEVRETPDPNNLGGFTLLGKPAPGACEWCAREHPPELPHDQQSLYYQMRFKAKHGCWPSWMDALAHCDQAMKDAWIEALEERGVDLDAHG